MEREAFRTGDVVKLKSGGPLMTVYEDQADENVDVSVCWMDAGGQEHDSSFPADCLDRYIERGHS